MVFKINDPFEIIKDTTISSAQVLALNATPQTIVPAQGANKVILFKRAVIRMVYNSVAYVVDANDDLNIRYTNGSGQAVAFIECTGFLDQTSTQVRFVNPASAGNGVLSYGAPVANSPLVLFMASTEVITGNSPLYVRVYYTVTDISTLGG